MHKRTKSLLEELQNIGNNRDTKHIIESRANNVITSAINLIEMINKFYDKETTEILEKKLLGAIKSKNQSKFTNSLKKLPKDKKND